MVSKIIKKPKTKAKTKTKPPKRPDFGLRRKKKSPIKSVASVISSIHRNLIKVFSKLARIGTPSSKSTKRNNKNPKKLGYQIIPQSPSSRRNLVFSLLPPSTSPHKRTLFLDLDETLIHSTSDPVPEKYDFVVCPMIDGVRIDFYVRKRPFVDEFLEFVAERFELVVFTAGLEEYASLVLDRLDWKGLICHRLYRDSCREVDGKLVKDLGEVGRDLKRVAIIDDNPNAYALHLENAIPVKPFVDDVADTELKKLIGFFEGCDRVEDMRDVAKLYLAGKNGEK